MRAAAELPLPEFSPEQIEAVDDSLVFPQEGSVVIPEPEAGTDTIR